ncbi:Down syndrome cell adhesion molecule-like protein Dscam2, partial [Dinothrombium tinctorium]
IQQAFDVNVYDEFAIRGNTGVLRCHIPSYVLDYVAVESWIRSDNVVIKPHLSTALDSRYLLFPSGELHVKNVRQQDIEFTYRCQIMDQLSGKTTLSNTAARLVVTESKEIAPRLIHRINSIKVRHNGNALIPCAAEGYPIVTVKWYKQHANTGNSLSPLEPITNRIQQHSDGTLVIYNAISEDSGQYLCVVNNNLGEQRTVTKLTVVAPLKATINPLLKTVSIGSFLTINCSILGHPIGDIIWFKDGKALLIDGVKYKTGSSRDTLTIQSIATDDKGIYQCLVSNEEESSQASIIITISYVAPELVLKPKNVTTKPDSRISLKCAAKGNPLPQISWTTYGQPVYDSGTFRIGDYVSSDGLVISFINISRISVQEGGMYQCRAINDFGTDSSSVWISVMGPPFIKPMNNVTVVAGENVFINCPYSAHHLSSILWHKGLRLLPLNRRQIVFSNGTLSVQSVSRPEDEGEYKCVVKNSGGEFFERSVHIKVLVAPTIATFNFPNSLQEGMRASITCTVTTGDPPIEIRWFKNGVLASVQENVYLENVDDFISNLIFKPLKQEHSGQYACVASNEAASVNHTVILSVDAPPRWRIEPSDKSAIVGHSLTVDCQAYGKPEPRVLWKKMSEDTMPGAYKTVISGSRIQTLVNGSLYFIDIHANDSGLYMCEASNGIGLAISAVIKVTVHIPAHFIEKYQSIKARKSEKVELVCKSLGELPIKVTWSKDGQFVDKMFTQYDIQEDASKQPDVPFGLRVMSVNSRNVQIGWTKPFDGHNSITKYIVQYKEANGVWERNSKEFTVDGIRTDTFIRSLLPITVYQLRVRAENNLGLSDWSDVLSVTTEEEVPEDVPKHIQVTAIGSKSIKVSWQRPSTKYHLAKVTGYYVGYKKHQNDASFVFKTVKSDTRETHYSTEITGLSKATKYSIIVQAFNSKGAGPLSDEIVVETTEFDIPRPPHLKVLSVTSNTIELTWSQPLEEENPIFGYILRYKKEDENQWHESQLMSDVKSHSLTALQCGTTHLISMQAFNTLGRSKASDIVSVKTLGSVPLAPEKENFIIVNSTFLLLNFNSWFDTDCQIDYFSVQYKRKNAETFVQLLDDAYFTDRIAYIRHLEPATWYDVWISARNGAGITEAQYRIATLTETGEFLHQQGDTNSAQIISLIVPLLSIVGVLLIIALFAVAFFYCNQETRNRSMINYSSSSADCSRKESECYAMNEMSIEKPNFIDHQQSADHHYNGDECVYLPSPYASTRIAANAVDCERMDRNQFLARNTSRSSSNVYDVPQNKHQAAMSTNAIEVPFLAEVKRGNDFQQQMEDNQSLGLRSDASSKNNRRALSLWNCNNSYGHILYERSNFRQDQEHE